MFEKVSETKYPPPDKPLLVWDGDCGFCKYWLLYIKARTGDRINFEPYQEAHDRFKDISLEQFRQASRIIEPDGMVYTGPDSLYRAMYYFDKPHRFYHRSYSRGAFFNKLSDYGYHWISMNRPFLYQVTIRMWGKNPVQRRPYWLIWLLLLILPIVVISVFI